MNVIDYPDKWIIKMFKFHVREAGDCNAKYYPDGTQLDEISLEKDEMVYGHFEANKRVYYFTSMSLIIVDKGERRIKIKEIVRVSGFFRSRHKLIDVEMSDGIIHKVLIAEFPYRIQQLFYQLVEKHASLIQEVLFQGPLKLEKISDNVQPQDLTKFGLSFEKTVVVRKIEISEQAYEIYYQGSLENDFVYSDEQGNLALKLSNRYQEIEIFNSKTDGYHGICNVAEGQSVYFDKNFKLLNKDISRLILVFGYSIEEQEFDELVKDMKLESRREINNLFGYVKVLVEIDGNIELLTEYETQ